MRRGLHASNRRAFRTARPRYLPALGLLAILALSLFVATPAPGQSADRDDASDTDPFLILDPPLPEIVSSPWSILDADAVVLGETKTVTLRPDTTLTEDVRIEKRILTYEGMDAEGDPHIPFNDRHQRLDVLRARTTTPEGRTYDTQENGFNLITPFPLAKAPFFTDGRELVVTHVGLDIGRATELHYRREDLHRIRTWLTGTEPLAGPNPIQEKSFTVTMPDEFRLVHAVLGADAAHESRRKRGVMAHSWTVAEVPLVNAGVLSDAEESYLPRIVYSTAGSWQDVTDGIYGRIEAARKMGDEIAAKVAELTGDETSGWRKLHLIHGFVHEHVAPVRWPLDRFPEALRTAAEVYRTRYGLPLERAILLAMMLGEAGIDADLVFLSRGPVIAKDVPALEQFPIPVVEAKVSGRTVMADPATSLEWDARSDHIGSYALAFRSGRFTITEVKEAVRGVNRLVAGGFLDFDEAGRGVGEMTVEMGGIYSPHLRLLLTGEKPGEYVKKLVSGIIEGCTVGDVDVIELSPQNSAFRAAVEIGPPVEDSLLVLAVGPPGESLVHTAENLHVQERAFPMLVGWTGLEQYEVSAGFPEEVGRVIVPSGDKVGGTSFTGSRSVFEEGESVRIRTTLDVKSKVIEPEDYPSFRDAVGLVTDRKAAAVYVVVE